MREVYKAQGYVLDPHGSVGYRALARHLELHPDRSGFFLETAHPVKFDSVNEIIGTYGEVPSAVNELISREKKSISLDNNYHSLKEIILSKI
jgi:threonine synthase